MSQRTEGRQHQRDPRVAADAQALVLQYLAIYDSYHNHKETMAYAATALYLGGAASFFVGDTYWEDYSLVDLLVMLALVLVLATIAVLFVNRQLRLRRAAGDMFLACSRLATLWSVEPPEHFTLVESKATSIDKTLFKGFLWPQALAEEVERVAGDRASVWWASALTYVAMFAAALLVLVRILVVWGA